MAITWSGEPRSVALVDVAVTHEARTAERELLPEVASGIGATSELHGGMRTLNANDSERLDRVVHLVEEYNHKLIAIARSHGLGLAEAEDVVQEAFIVLLRRRDDLASGAERAFLFATARKLAYKAVRKRGRKYVEISDDSPVPGSETASPEGRCVLTFALQEMERMLLKLPLEQVDVFILHDFCGYNLSEIAEMLGRPEGTTKRQLQRAHKRLESLLARESKK